MTTTNQEIALASGKSLRALSGDKTIDVKRVNGFSTTPEMLWIEEGYNVRNICSKHVDGFVQSYLNDKFVPPIEVTPVIVNGQHRLKVVEGHHRTLGLWEAVKQGKEIASLTVMEVTGNEVQHLARMITSAQGRPLNAVEMASAYQRFVIMGLSQAEIAEELSVTTAQVSNYLLLVKAPRELQDMIKTGEAKVTNVCNNIRSHGGDIALVMAKEDQTAKEQKKEAKAKGLKVTGNSATKKVKLSKKNVVSMTTMVSELANQVTVEDLEGDKEVTLKMDASMAKLLLSLAAEITDVQDQNAKVDALMLELAIKAKQGQAESATQLKVVSNDESQMTFDDVVAA
ncbi:ParB/RepB/Spo0J family partition protein [Vibrio splendidus]|nr:hypothetical protein [Vibrio splendidus]MCC4883004.1 hypothetical protein [Vibrio splendidus]